MLTWQSSHFSLRVSIIRHQIKIPFSPFSFLIHSLILWFLSLTCTAILFSPLVYFGVPFHLFAIASVCLDINLDSSTQCCKVFPSNPSSCATFTLQQHQWIVFYCFLICLYNCNRCFRHQKFLVLIPAQNKAHSYHHIVVVFFKVMYIVELYFLCFELHHVFAWRESFVFLYSVFATGAWFYFGVHPNFAF